MRGLRVNKHPALTDIGSIFVKKSVKTPIGHLEGYRITSFFSLIGRGNVLFLNGGKPDKTSTGRTGDFGKWIYCDTRIGKDSPAMGTMILLSCNNPDLHYDREASLHHFTILPLKLVKGEFEPF